MMIACQMKIRLLREALYISNLYACVCVYVGLLTNTLWIFTKEETTAWKIVNFREFSTMFISSIFTYFLFVIVVCVINKTKHLVEISSMTLNLFYVSSMLWSIWMYVKTTLFRRTYPRNGWTFGHMRRTNPCKKV